MQTFLVRVWTPAAGEEDDERRPLSGVVEHVATRRGTTFHGELDLLDFIRGCVQAPPEVLPAVVDEV
jgi:hypothetical protein